MATWTTPMMTTGWTPSRDGSVSWTRWLAWWVETSRKSISGCITAVATDLVCLEGLASGELFAPNVRQWLGRTKVNKDIAASISDHAEHKNLILYHNGVTFVCSEIDLSEPSKLTIASA